MLDFKTARELVIEELKCRNLNTRTGFELVINEEATREVEYGWIFYYQTKLFLETKNRIYTKSGCFPILVDKLYENLHYLEAKNGSLEEHLKEYGNRRGQAPQYSKYYDFYEFLECYLRTGSRGSFLNEQEAVSFYVLNVNVERVQNVITSAKVLLEEDCLSLGHINKLTQRNFPNLDSVRNWLLQVVQLLEYTQKNQ